jgi:hypothetical protein
MTTNFKLGGCMSNFIKALDLAINEMQAVSGDNMFCLAVYPCDLKDDSVIVMFMEYEYYKTMHAVMKDLHARLTDKLGHPPSICHNHPTDENVLIHGEPNMASVYYADECCKRDDIDHYKSWVAKGKDPERYRPELRAIFYAAECIADNSVDTPVQVLESLDWNQDPQTQLIKMLVDFHA